MENKEFDSIRIGLAHAQLVVAHGQFHGVAQGGNLTDIDLNTLGDAHVHDAALHGAFAMQLCHRCGLADLDVFQSLHCKSSSTCLYTRDYSSFGAAL